MRYLDQSDRFRPQIGDPLMDEVQLARYRATAVVERTHTLLEEMLYFGASFFVELVRCARPAVGFDIVPGRRGEARAAEERGDARDTGAVHTVAGIGSEAVVRHEFPVRARVRVRHEATVAVAERRLQIRSRPGRREYPLRGGDDEPDH